MRRVPAALLILVALATPASAARWNVMPGKSRLGFAVTWSGQQLVATFKSWKAEIVFDPADLAHAKAVVVIDMASEDSGSAENDDALKGAEAFAVDRFGTARFETTAFTDKGGGNYVANGRLDLHGISKPLTLPFTLTFNGDTVHMAGKAVVMRTDFGLGASGEWAGETPVAHAVTITVDLTATKAR
jgi:polyisoprenoid-binding protein YceI